MGILLFVLNSIIIVTSIICLIICLFFIDNLSLLYVFPLCILIFGIVIFKTSYRYLLNSIRKQLNNTTFSEKEMKIIEDAKSLIRSVDPSITLSEFIVYKVNYGRDCWFHYDKKRQERCVFISLKTLLKYGEDACFMCVLHELLHSQNIKPNMGFFKRSYLEGINQFFTLWLIENYSDKYNVPDVVTFRIRVIGIKIGFQAYDKEVARVKKVIEKENVDLKEMFLNYLNMNSAYFKEFIPLNWYK